eukprot:GHUV01039457.1.p2 GENE.GHUV01039457.1~~GHUV01039457.1.p2  ORF type:complete len:107 (+),score=14.94 GHUV01039457.1:643-963(+)
MCVLNMPQHGASLHVESPGDQGLKLSTQARLRRTWALQVLQITQSSTINQQQRNLHVSNTDVNSSVSASSCSLSSVTPTLSSTKARIGEKSNVPPRGGMMPLNRFK